MKQAILSFVFSHPGLTGGIFGGLGVLVLCLLIPARSCPACARRLPRARKPRTLQQALYGGWNCPGCGAEVDRRGTLVQRR